MIKEKEQLFRKLLMVLDMLVVLVAFFVAFILRQHIHLIYKMDIFPGKQIIGEIYGPSRYLNLLPLILFTWWASLSASG